MSAITRAFQGVGYTAVGFEILKDPDWMDIMTNQGMLTALTLTLALVTPWGLNWLGIVCSSWIFMSRSQTKRSMLHPLGTEESCASVAVGNTMVARCCLLLLLTLAKRCWYVVEQPKSSLMKEHCAMVYLSELQSLPWVQEHMADTYMGAFQGDSEKPHVLLSNRYWIHALTRDRPTHMARSKNTKQNV